jgi:hypothetical protein
MNGKNPLTTIMTTTKRLIAPLLLGLTAIQAIAADAAPAPANPSAPALHVPSPTRAPARE